MAPFTGRAFFQVNSVVKLGAVSGDTLDRPGFLFIPVAFFAFIYIVFMADQADLLFGHQIV